MQSQTTTKHQLQVGIGPDWAQATANMYQPAHSLANQGNLIEAIEIATRIRIGNYGEADSLDIKFRIVTTTITEIKQ